MNSSGDQFSGRQIGKGMVAVAWILGLVLLTYGFNKMLQDQHNPNRQPQSHLNATGSPEVVLKRNRAGHYIASGLINGQPVILLLDTGATDVAVPGRLAEKLGLIRGNRHISRTANGQVTSWSSRLDRVEIGNLRLDNIRASILPSMDGQEVLLGMSFLKRLELIQQGDTLTLRKGRS